METTVPIEYVFGWTLLSILFGLIIMVVGTLIVLKIKDKMTEKRILKEVRELERIYNQTKLDIVFKECPYLNEETEE